MTLQLKRQLNENLLVHKNLIVARLKIFNSISFISVPKIFILLQRFTSIFIKQIKKILSLILNILMFIYNSKKKRKKEEEEEDWNHDN